MEDKEDEESLEVLTELLAQDGVDPNAGDDASLNTVRQTTAMRMSAFVNG